MAHREEAIGTADTAALRQIGGTADTITIFRRRLRRVGKGVAAIINLLAAADTEDLNTETGAGAETAGKNMAKEISDAGDIGKGNPDADTDGDMDTALDTGGLSFMGEKGNTAEDMAKGLKDAAPDGSNAFQIFENPSPGATRDLILI